MPRSGAAASAARAMYFIRYVSFSAEDAPRPPEHDRNEENEREHVAPLELEEEAAHRDELREQERGDEAADHVAQAPEHANEEGDRSEGQADRRMDVVLQHQQAGGEAR